MVTYDKLKTANDFGQSEFQKLIQASMQGAKNQPLPAMPQKQGLPQAGGYQYNGQTYNSVAEQQAAMAKNTPDATTQAPAGTTPTYNEAVRKKFQIAQQPGITEGINTVTSQINPFMTGQRAGAITENVLKPATQAYAQFDIEQAKEEQAAANQAITDTINTLQPIIASGKATDQMKAQYNAAVAKKLGATTPTAGATTPTAPTDYASATAPSAGAKVSSTFDADYGDRVARAEAMFGPKLGTIKMIVDDKNDPTLTSQYNRLQQLASIVDSKVASAQEVAEFEQLANYFGQITGKETGR